MNNLPRVATRQCDRRESGVELTISRSPVQRSNHYTTEPSYRCKCSAGVCMWEIMNYGVKPFPELQNNQVIDVIERGERLSRPSTCPLAVYTLMSACWMYRPSDRPNFAFIKARLRSATAARIYACLLVGLGLLIIINIETPDL